MNDSATSARRTAYIVLSHRAPDQVTRLVRAILRSSPSSRVVVQHDSRKTEAPRVLDDRVLVLSHGRPTDWGSWDIVAATLEALGLAREVFDPGLVVLVSGQDYPVRHLASWEEEFREEGRGWAGTGHRLRYNPRWGRPSGEGDDDLTRYTYRWYRVPFSRALGGDTAVARCVRWPLWKLGHHLEPVLDVRAVSRGRGIHIGVRSGRTPFGPTQPCYKGSQWWAMDRRLLDVVLERAQRDRRLMSTYRRSIIPDESFFQSAIAPVCDPSKGHPVSYVEWIVEADAPRVLDMSDLHGILGSGSPFCRKVEPGISDALMDRLDERSAAPRR